MAEFFEPAAAVHKVRGGLKRVLSWGNHSAWTLFGNNNTKYGWRPRYLVADGYTVAGKFIGQEYVASVTVNAARTHLWGLSCSHMARPQVQSGQSVSKVYGVVPPTLPILQFL